MKFSVENRQNKRQYQEDRYCCHKFSNNMGWLFAVFDGHGGSFVSNLLSNLYPKELEKKLQIYLQKLNGKSCSYNAIKNIITDLHGYLTVFLLKKNFKNAYNMGTTMTGCLVFNNMVFTINCGDSRTCVFFKKGNSISLFETIDHKPSHKKESIRIHQSGGLVRKFSHRDVPRVVSPNNLNFGLSVSHGFGDFQMLHPTTKRFIVSFIPDVSLICPLSQLVFIFCASDGIWDVINSNEILLACRNGTRGICDLAQQRGSTDNLTSLLVWKKNQ